MTSHPGLPGTKWVLGCGTFRVKARKSQANEVTLFCTKGIELRCGWGDPGAEDSRSKELPSRCDGEGTLKGLEQRLDMMGWDYIIISGVNKS